MNFIWDVRQHLWDIRLKELKKFLRDHGHCIVPINYECFPKLGAWVRTVRHNKREQKKETSKKRFHISDKQIADLDYLDFEWDPCEAQWLEMYYKLKKHYETHDHTVVITDKTLYRWIAWNRFRCKEEKRIMLLNSIGVTWPESRSHNAEIRSRATDAIRTHSYKYSLELIRL